MSDTCYEFFEANIEGAHGLSRIVLNEIGIARRLKTGWAYFRLLLEIRKYFKIMHDLFEKALNAAPDTVVKYPMPSADPRKILEDAKIELKKTAQDCLRIKQKLMAITKNQASVKILYRLVLEHLTDELFENIETLYLVVEAVLEEKGEYITAEEILASLS